MGMVCACNHAACKRMCECADNNSDNCVERCEDDMDDLSKDCQRETRNLARCLDYNDCEASECQGEYEDWADECLMELQIP